MRWSEPLRVFSASKVVQGKLANQMGLQLARVLVARGLYNLRRNHNFDEYAARLLEDGIVVIEDAFELQEFEALRSECARLIQSNDSYAHHDHGGAIVDQWDVSQLGEDYPAIERMLSGSSLAARFSAAEKRPIALRQGMCALERVTQQSLELDDQESHLHVDTFFSNHKGWLYLNDVTPDHGPFAFVPTSHKLTGERLRRIYKNSVGENLGSRRIGQDELDAHGLSERRYTAKANTLVIANTCGYHRRTRGVPGKTRQGLIFSFRQNPFVPAVLDRAAHKLRDTARRN